MVRGPKKHMKRSNAPKHWMLDKMGGMWAPRPSTGPHKLRECLPVILILRQRLKYALTGREATQICMQKLVKVDQRVRTDPNFPAGFMDVISLDKAGDNFRLLYDTKGRFVLQPLTKRRNTIPGSHGRQSLGPTDDNAKSSNTKSSKFGHDGHVLSVRIIDMLNLRDFIGFFFFSGFKVILP